jgi:hypothetical protein
VIGHWSDALAAVAAAAAAAAAAALLLLLPPPLLLLLFTVHSERAEDIYRIVSTHMNLPLEEVSIPGRGGG